MRFCIYNVNTDDIQRPRPGDRDSEHDLEKWTPVFRRNKRGKRLRGDHTQIKEIERGDDPKKCNADLST
jgi:hypothetical protein